MSEKERLAALSAEIASVLQGAPERPKLRLITREDLPPKPPRIFRDDERAWACNEIRLWCSVYPIETYVRRQMRGCVTPEELDDESLRAVLDYAGRCVQCIRDEVPFDEAGIL